MYIVRALFILFTAIKEAHAAIREDKRVNAAFIYTDVSVSLLVCSTLPLSYPRTAGVSYVMPQVGQMLNEYLKRPGSCTTQHTRKFSNMIHNFQKW